VDKKYSIESKGIIRTWWKRHTYNGMSAIEFLGDVKNGTII
jgi:hypothetical protein